MVLAHRHHLDVADEYELLVVGLERRTEHLRRLDTQPGEQLGVGASHAGRGLLQTFAVRVLADRDEDLADGRLDPRQVDRGVDVGAAQAAADQPGGDMIELAIARIRSGSGERELVVIAIRLGATRVAQFEPSVPSPPPKRTGSLSPSRTG
jgi:hypothetical protein